MRAARIAKLVARHENFVRISLTGNPKASRDPNAAGPVHGIENSDSHQYEVSIRSFPVKNAPCPEHDIETFPVLVARKPEKGLAVRKPLRRPPGVKDIGFNAKRRVMDSSESGTLQDLGAPVRSGQLSVCSDP
jgi:hypothetical protein